MQYWPRKRAKKEAPRIHSWALTSPSTLLGFAGYKAGMTHVMVIDNAPHSKTKGEEIVCPVTIVECPPLKILGAHFYKQTSYGLKMVTSLSFPADKILSRKLTLPKKHDEARIDAITPASFDEVRLVVYTQPSTTGIGKKKPEVFEIGLCGTKEQQLTYIKEHKGKDLNITDVFKPGQFVDICAVTKGKGTQGPVKRFGVTIRSHKSEKTIRGPASLGAWCGQGHMMYRVAHAGKMGYHTRTELNKRIISIVQDPAQVNPAGGFIRYGVLKNPCVLVLGSLPGPKKRMVRMIAARRTPAAPVAKDAPTVTVISKSSHQGN